MTDVRLRVGGHTDVGQLRDQNQDSILLGPVLFGVADGMGGHQGGEVASALAAETIVDELSDDATPTTDELVAAVLRANRNVYDRSGEDPTVAGMGTTLVGVALVDDGDEEHLVVLNVGDSRGYRFRSGELAQVTVDHSLVGELLRDGRITEEEAEVHPQRNIITRVLGVDSDVVVDTFHFPASGGDRFLLCSDGLTNEVPEVEIEAVLGNFVDPDEAAHELVRQANDNGGRDNITVVIVDVEGPEIEAFESGGGLVPDADDFSHTGEDTASYAPIDAPDGADHDGADDDESDRDETADSGKVATTRRERRAETRARRAKRRSDRRRSETPRSERPRAITVRSIVFVAVVLALIGGGAFLINDYATNTYHVKIDDGQVAIFKGRPGGFLWVEPELVETTDLDAADVLAADRGDLEEGVAQPDLNRARQYVENLRERIEQVTPPVTTTTKPKTSKTTTSTEP